MEIVKTIVYIATNYLQWATPGLVSRVRASGVRMVLITYEGERVAPALAAYFDHVIPVTAALNEGVRPVLNLDEVRCAIEKEMRMVGGPNAIRILCQEEGNVHHAAMVREQLGIPGDTVAMVERFRNKLIMKQVVEDAGIRTPKHLKFDFDAYKDNPNEYYSRLGEILGERLVLKPVDAAGSLNVSIISRFSDLQSACANIEESPYDFEYEIDEFIDGIMYQSDSFVHQGGVEFTGTFELGCTNFDFVMGKPLTGFPAVDPELKRKLEDYNARVIRALGMQNGCTHHEYFLDKKTGEPVFLEIACRAPGGVGVYFHIKNKNYNMMDAYLIQNTSPEALDELKVDARDNVVAALLPVGHGRVVSLQEPEVKSDFEIRWLIEEGSVVNSRTIADAAGILTMRNDDIEQLRIDFEALQSYTPVLCDPD
ncbi:ATP-grasp domain-containing protein [Paraburkholderia acidisoli]|uniref:ATP-grasp domain-containing protein n=1 Tax=Paraburkholderia acidisoli TaxID=2571748 RepID=A0A7Z2GN45_9BURK|nr:ATP-grasp domain-containing protein [Paraburkholderia acidisoli]QGZ64600.1 ATP-grasp domain-containing protein [Paraburkholderia acidisoli]